MSLIVGFEGPDGYGKTTLINSVSNALISNRKTCKIFKMPTESIFGKLARKMIKEEKPDPVSLVSLFFTDNVVANGQIKESLLLESINPVYDVLLLDRTSFSFYPYAKELLKDIDPLILSPLVKTLEYPALCFLLVGEEKNTMKENKDYLEKLPVKNIEENYNAITILSNISTVWHKIDNRKGLNAMTREVMDKIEEMLPYRDSPRFKRSRPSHLISMSK